MNAPARLRGVECPGVRCAAVGVRDLLYSVYERKLSRELAGAAARPRHVAVMLDGNRRWARDAGFVDVNDGHRVGAAKIADLLAWCEEAGVEVVTLWLLSTDNLNRPSDELEPLLKIITDVVDELSGPAARWRLRVVGALELLPGDMADRLSAATTRTQGRPGLELNVAVGYGGRQEIADAVRKLLLQHAESGTSIEELAEVLDVDHIAAHLYTSGQPDPDLRRAAAVRFPALAVRALGVLVLRGLLARVPPSGLPARTPRLRRSPPPVRLLSAGALDDE